TERSVQAAVSSLRAQRNLTTPHAAPHGMPPDGPARPLGSDPQLLSLAVHEFRTPASVVGGYLRMLQRDADPPLSERQRRMVDEAEKSCARVVAIVAQLGDIGKLDSGSRALGRH